MDRIYLHNKLVAVRVRRFPDGTSPVSLPDGALQLLTIRRPSGHVVKAHRHVPQKRVTKMLQECLVVIRGKIRYDLFDAKGKCFKKVVVKAGEAMLVLGAGHAVHFLAPTLAYELKNGPFFEDKKFL